MWTEIINEELCVTHVDGHHVIVPLDTDVEPRTVRDTKRALRRRDALTHIHNEMVAFGNELERQLVFQRQLASLLDDESDVTL